MNYGVRDSNCQQHQAVVLAKKDGISSITAMNDNENN